MILGITASSRVAAAGSSGPAFRSASTAQSSTGSLTTTIPSGTVSGDILVLTVFLLYDGKSGLPGTAPTGWTQRAFIDPYPGSSSDILFAVYTKTAGSSESAAVWSGGSNWIDGQSSMISISSATAVDVTGSVNNVNSVTATSFVAPSITTTTTTDLLIGILANYTGGGGSGSGSFVPPYTVFPSPMTSRSSVIYDGFIYKELSVATQTLSASASTGTRTMTWNGNPVIFSSFCVLLAVK
jgi:hypothetical protein